VEHQGTGLVAGRPALIVGVAEAVCAQVQTRRRAELEQPHRVPERRTDVEQTAHERGGAPYFVGLWCAVEPLADAVRLLAQQRTEGAPRRLRIPLAAHAGVVPRQVGRPAAEDEPVHAAGKSQCQRRGPGIVLVPGQDGARDAAPLDVLGDAAQQRLVHRGTEPAAGLRLQSEVARRPHVPSLALRGVMR